MNWNNTTYWRWLETADRRSEVTGKYLFFSRSAAALEKIAEDECRDNGFFLAKISTEPGGSGDYVLCLYWIDDSRKRDLAKRHAGNDAVRYRYWKSNEATRRGEYSQQFMNGQ